MEVKKAYDPDVAGKGSTKELKTTSNKERGAHVNAVNTGKTRIYSFDEEEALYHGSQFLSRIIQIPLLDALKGEVKILFGKEEDQTRYDNYIKLHKLDPFKVAKETIIETRKHGTAIVYPHVKSIRNKTNEPLNEISEVLGFKVWHDDLIEKIKLDKDPFSLTFEEVVELKVKKGNEVVAVDPSRVFITWNDDIKNLRNGEEEYRGISTINKLSQEITGYITSKWSLTEIIHRLTFLLFNVEKGEALKDSEKAEYLKELDTLSQVFMGKEDTIKAINSGNGVNPKIWIEGMIMPFSIATGIPVYRLLGSQEGALATSTENRLQYNALLESVIRKNLEEVIKYCVDLICRAIKLGTYKVDWPDLNQLGEKEKTDNNEAKARTLKLIFEGAKIHKESRVENGATGVIEDLMKELGLDEDLIRAITGGGSES